MDNSGNVEYPMELNYENPQQHYSENTIFTDGSQYMGDEIQGVMGQSGFVGDNGYIGDSGYMTNVDVDDETLGLYNICNEARLNARSTVKQSIRGRSVLNADSHWTRIRNWLEKYTEPKDRIMALSYKGEFSYTCLHLCCMLHDPPLDIMSEIVQSFPEAVTWIDSHNRLPLHYAGGNAVSLEVVRLICESYPKGKVEQDQQGHTPLHSVFSRGDTKNLDQIVELLSDSGAAEVCSNNDYLPMHFACAYGTTTQVLKVLYDAYPQSIAAVERRGKTPLHLAMVNAYRPASQTALSFLLSAGGKGLVDMKDGDGVSGQLPLYNLAVTASGWDDADNQEAAHQNAIKCLNIYLNAKPKGNADFLTALQALPSWLRDVAVIHPHVQGILNDKISQRFPTAVLIADFFCLILIIIAFEVGTAESIDYFANFEQGITEDVRYAWPYKLLISGGVYFLFREFVQIVSLISLGNGLKSWYTDFSNLIDLTVIFLSFLFAVLIKNIKYNEVDQTVTYPGYFRHFAAVSKLLIWFAMISFMRSTRVDFAVFVGGVMHVLRRLAAGFLIALIVILIAFSQMFVFIYKGTSTCEPKAGCEEPNFSNISRMEYMDYTECLDAMVHCKPFSSFLKVYTMMMGEIGDEKRYNAEGAVTIAAQLIYVAFAFFVVILLSNVLIAIVTDTYSLIQHDRADMVFWSNRLDFVAEMDAIVSVLKRMRSVFKHLWCFHHKDSSHVPGAPRAVNERPAGEEDEMFYDNDGNENATDHKLQKRKITNTFRNWWDYLMGLFDPNQYEDIDMSIKNPEFWLFLFFKFITIIIIPVWLLIGLGTLGVLWPPQVRETLLVQQWLKSTYTSIDAASEVTEEAKLVQENLKDMQEKLKTDMYDDRKEINVLQKNVQEIHRQITDDLSQIKELMMTLLNSKNSSGME